MYGIDEYTIKYHSKEIKISILTIEYSNKETEIKDIMSKKMIEQVAIIFSLCTFQSPLIVVQ